MVTTKKRNSHNYWIKPLTFSTPLLEGESIGSWIIRASLSQKCTLTTFMGFYWQHVDDRLDRYDFDKGFEHVKPDVHEDMAILAETTVDRFNKQTLTSFAREQGLISHSSSALKWTLPLSRRHLYGRFGHPYCPDCMADNEKSHLKLRWRLAWSVYCDEHHRVLQTNCPHCDIPYQPLLAKIENRYINFCCHCDGKIDKAIIPTEHIDNDVLKFQQLAQMVWHNKYGYVLNQKVTSGEWFEFILFAVNMVRVALKNPEYMFGRLLAEFDIDIAHTKRPSTGSRLELLPAIERVELFKLVSQLLQVAKEQWLKSGEIVGLTQNSFNWNKKTEIPKAFMPVYTRLKSNPKREYKQRERGNEPKSFETILMEWHRLKRKLEARDQYERHLESGQRDQTL